MKFISTQTEMNAEGAFPIASREDLALALNLPINQKEEGNG